MEASYNCWEVESIPFRISCGSALCHHNQHVAEPSNRQTVDVDGRTIRLLGSVPKNLCTMIPNCSVISVPVTTHGPTSTVPSWFMLFWGRVT